MHREIYRAIRSRKPAEARKLMEQHLRMAQTAQGKERVSNIKSLQAAAKPSKPAAKSKPTSKPTSKPRKAPRSRT
jgi:dihydrodipicolinate synthase/N-acetylneuraminate lyase